MAKTVYVLGAGFSRDAAFPMQAGIMQSVDGLSRRVASLDVGLMHVPSNALEVFTSSRADPFGTASRYEELTAFVKSVFRSDIARTELEDLFTLLDLSIAQGHDCDRYSVHDLVRLRETLKECILLVFHDLTQRVEPGPSRFYRSVAAHLLERRMSAGQGADPFTVVSLNWDAMLEEALYWCLGQAGGVGKGDIDYCCFTTPLPGCPHTPSILQKSKGIFNIKVIKLHGSASWLTCPNCDRLFTGLGSPESLWAQYVVPRRCEFCKAKFRLKKEVDLEGYLAGREPAILRPFFITPTYVKIFDNVHIQMAWHNALLDLSEADEVVFIGYSLPEADYHVRALLRRAVRPDAQIVVVLMKDAEPPRKTPAWLKRHYAAQRYRTFFGKNRVSLELGGVASYFTSMMSAASLPSRIRKLRKRFLQHTLRTGSLAGR